MGQFIEQMQQINAVQNEILTERKRKQKAKEQKEFLKYLIDKYKLEIIETIEQLRDEPYNNILYSINIQEIFASFRQKLSQYDYFDKQTINLKAKELENFTYKEITRQKAIYKKIQLEEATAQKQQEKATKEYLQQCEKEIYLLFERTYKKYGYIAYNKLSNCKYDILKYLYGNNYTYKNIAFYERLNKQFSKQYPQKQKVNYLSAVCLGIIYGLYRGFKNTNKRK